jgi:hypothetical protein
MKDIFYDQLKHAFNKLPKYRMEILLDFRAKVDREDIFKPITVNEIPHEISNDNGVRVVNLLHTKL